MPKWSAATSTTSRAAPTTSGPMPSPGSNNISNELRMILLELRPRLKPRPPAGTQSVRQKLLGDRKSTRLNSSHANISYAVFCLKKKKKTKLLSLPKKKKKKKTQTHK